MHSSSFNFSSGNCGWSFLSSLGRSFGRSILSFRQYFRDCPPPSAPKQLKSNSTLMDAFPPQSLPPSSQMPRLEPKLKLRLQLGYCKATGQAKSQTWTDQTKPKIKDKTKARKNTMYSHTPDWQIRIARIYSTRLCLNLTPLDSCNATFAQLPSPTLSNVTFSHTPHAWSHGQEPILCSG